MKHTIITITGLLLLSFSTFSQTQIGQTISGDADFNFLGGSVSVSADGNIMATALTNNGQRVRVYENISEVWTQIGTDIFLSFGNTGFGESISLSADGNIVAIGASRTNNFAGSTGIYENIAGIWTQIGTNIIGEVDGDRSGQSVSLSADGSIIAIGSPLNDGTGLIAVDAGQVRIYENVLGTWTQIGQDIHGEAQNDRSGSSVSISANGNIVSFGAIGNDGNGNSSGHTRVAQNIGGIWVQIGQDIDGEAAGDESGGSVSLNANGNIVAIGAGSNTNGNGIDSGHVRIFENIAGTWTQLGQDIDGEAAGDRSGGGDTTIENLVSLNDTGNVVAIGAPFNDENGNNSGHVRIFENIAGIWTQIGMDINGEAVSDEGGELSLSADGTTVVIGAANNTMFAGQVRVFATTVPLPLLCPLTTTYTIAGGWDNGVPDDLTAAIIAENYNTTMLGNITACALTIETAAILTIGNGDFVSVVNNITVDGILVMQHQSSLVQEEEDAITTNNGTITVTKTTPSIEARNFVAMSSPMSAETRDGVYANSRAVFDIIPQNFVPFNIDLMAFPEFIGAENFLDDNNDYLLSSTGSNPLPVPGIGQLVFPSSSHDSPTAAYDLDFTQGTLNSGTITVPIHYNGPATINNYNLLGNPYASAIDVTAFIAANDAVNEVYYWDHLTNPTSALPGFGTSNFSMNDISMRNAMMGVIAMNGGTVPGQFMASGQGFGIKADQAEMMANTPVVFTNSIRVTGNNDGFRSSAIENNLDKLWLSLTTSAYEEAQSQTAIGFTSQASAGFDKGYDSSRLGTFLSLFSTLDTGEQLSIQGREAFDSTIEITLGFATTVEENTTYTIRIDRLEGLSLENASVFLIDHLLNTSTNLKETPYTFTSHRGMHTERFTVVFEERDVLGIDDEGSFRESVTLYPNPATNQVTLSYYGEKQLQELIITDLQGKVVKIVSLKDFTDSKVIDTSALAKGMYFIQIQSDSDIITQKLIIK